MKPGFDVWADPNQEGVVIGFECDLRHFETDRQVFFENTRLFRS
jgi:hypothetical protein